MIVRLTGVLTDVDEGAVVVEHDGIAREVLVPAFSLGELASVRGGSITLHTLEFYEGNQSSGSLTPRLLGFVRKEDREFFERFLDVKGIGPRKALKALAEPAWRIAGWIEAGDAKAIARLPGIGNRGAELVVASLRGKMNDLAMLGPVSAPRAAVEMSQPMREALEILVSLGDPRAEVEQWLDRVARSHPELAAAEDIIRAAYRVRSGME